MEERKEKKVKGGPLSENLAPSFFITPFPFFASRHLKVFLSTSSSSSSSFGRKTKTSCLLEDETFPPPFLPPSADGGREFCLETQRRPGKKVISGSDLTARKQKATAILQYNNAEGKQKHKNDALSPGMGKAIGSYFARKKHTLHST